MKNIIRILGTQGARDAETVFTELLAAGIVTEEATALSTAALLVGITAPAGVDLADYTNDRLNATHELEDTFEETLIQALEREPSSPKISQLAICQQTPWLTIRGIGGEVAEFTGTGYKRQAFRTEFIIAGCIISALAMKLKFAVVESGWKASCPGELEPGIKLIYQPESLPV